MGAGIGRRVRLAFADASFLMPAMLDEQSRVGRVRALRDELSGTRLVTSVGVLEEVLARAARLGPAVRADAAKMARGILADRRRCIVVYPTPELVERALALYEARSDQRYSLVDCISMAVMDEMGIRHVLPFDRDFHGEGRYVVLPPRG